MTIKVGGHVIFIDADRKEHDALVQHIHGKPEDQPSINLLYVAVENGNDDYGAQKKHETSIVNIKDNSAKGFCWKEP